MWLHFMELTGTTFMVKVDPVDSQPIIIDSALSIYIHNFVFNNVVRVTILMPLPGAPEFSDFIYNFVLISFSKI